MGFGHLFDDEGQARFDSQMVPSFLRVEERTRSLLGYLFSPGLHPFVDRIAEQRRLLRWSHLPDNRSF